MAQKRIVLQRSGNRCAYTGCDRSLVIDAGIEGTAKSVGKIAHITAASPAGPRFDATMSTAQRGDASNLIVLCSDHHDLIDSAVDKHPNELLRAMKADHEERVTRAVRAATIDIELQDLEVVCVAVASLPFEERGEIELSMPLKNKLALNRLGPTTSAQIETGLAQAPRVQQFIEFRTQDDPDFERRLLARVKAWYYAAVANQLDGDAAFDYVLSCGFEASGPRDSERIRAAVLALVSLVFEICEIFDHA